MSNQPYFSGKTLDDVMKLSIDALFSSGQRVSPTRGENIELTGVLLEIEDPRSRLSRSEMRGKPFSCLGELLWYLRKTNAVDIIEYYIHNYRKYADEDGRIYGGYGPRFFEWDGINQFRKVADLLIENPSTRKAVIQIFDAQDLVKDHKDIPCTCLLQFFIREGHLHMITYMRSNDAYWGLPHDVFSFTMLQEIMARTVGVELGTYKHSIGSFHLYDKDTNAAASFLKEGWQSTQNTMPPMPEGDPWPAIELVLEAEAKIRQEGADAFTIPSILDPYWADLIRLLQLFRHFHDKEGARAKIIQKELTSNIYNTFINKKLDKLEH